MTKLEYAAQYDRQATVLYRFALLTLGEPRAAERAVKTAFVSGYAAQGKAPHTLQRIWLTLLWQSCAQSIPMSGRRYVDALQAAGVEASLGEMPLANLYWDERALLLLAALFRLDLAQCAEISRQPRLRIERRLAALGGQMEDVV
ncbi:MAG: hypothetical protein RRY21_06955, partial [Oscillospiraceae bacterium]